MNAFLLQGKRILDNSHISLSIRIVAFTFSLFMRFTPAFKDKTKNKQYKHLFQVTYFAHAFHQDLQMQFIKMQTNARAK